MRRFIQASVLVLVLALAVPAFADDIPNGVTGDIPNNVTGYIPNGVAATGDMQNGVAGEIPYGVTGNIPYGDTSQTNVINFLLSLFSLI